MHGVFHALGVGFLLQRVSPGSVITGNFQYLPVKCYDQQIPETKAAINWSFVPDIIQYQKQKQQLIGHSYQILFEMARSQKM